MFTRDKVNFQKVILGTANFGQTYGITNKHTLSDDEVFNILDRAHTLGISTLDTASGYGRSEEIIGKYHSKRNFAFKVNTKISNIEKLTSIEKSTLVEKALSRLNVDSVENLFFHNMDTINSVTNIGKFIEETLDSGLVRSSIGVSIYDIQEAILASTKFPKLDLFQIHDNILTRTLMNEVIRAKIKVSGIKMQVRSIFLQGVLIANQELLSNELNFMNSAVMKLEEIANRLGTNRLGLCLSYMNLFPDEFNFVIAVNSPEQLNEIANAKLINLSNLILEELPPLNKDISDPRNWKV